MPRITISKEFDKKLAILKLKLDTKDTSEALLKLVEAWEEKHGELKV